MYAHTSLAILKMYIDALWKSFSIAETLNPVIKHIVILLTAIIHAQLVPYPYTCVHIDQFGAQNRDIYDSCESIGHVTLAAISRSISFILMPIV